MENGVYKVIAATGIPLCDEDLKKQSDFIVQTCNLKTQLPQLVEEFEPQIIVVSDQISGEENLIKMILDLKNKYHYIRFIYLAGNVDAKDTSRFDALGMLVLVGIYDIVISSTINIDLIMDAIENPKKEQSVMYLTKNLLTEKHEIENSIGGLNYETYDTEENQELVIPNLFTFGSVKPGTGKSFLSVNTACAIAAYGKAKKDGSKPKVALVEADMQTLSIGTLLSIDEKKGSLKTVMESVSTIFEKGSLIDDMEKRKKVNKTIKNCMVPYGGLSNLHVLVGSSLTPEELDMLSIIPEYFTYIIDVLKDEYDYIIIDTNSSIFHVSSFAILRRAKTCFYILNLDFNNIRNNLRYANTLKDIGIFQKVKYILNENIANTKEFYGLGVNIEELNFTADDIEKKYFDLIAKIPSLPKTIFLNRLYEGRPVVLDKNSVEYTNKTKLELLKVANGICELNDEYSKLKDIVENEGKKNFNLKGIFGKKRNKKE
ncbi:AAA family ATPase [Hungatella hathewayi]|uniref:AAA family ATPase n=1 Tax=Hungatella hathewayi TaxID=154046 RepID=UPI0035648FA6